MSGLTILRAGPLTTLQDRGRFGMLRHGISASGPMDRGAFERAGAALPVAGSTAIEYTQGLAFVADAPLLVAAPEPRQVAAGEQVEIAPAAGNYGYLRFEREIEMPLLLGSRATNLTVGLGGKGGRALKTGDRLELGAPGAPVPAPAATAGSGPIRVIWGLHAALLGSEACRRFAAARFVISSSLDRMGVQLLDPAGVFREPARLSLVSDAIVPGDIQILGDGTPVVLMRDHQPTGGYPRIATVVSADLDRFAQLRPGTEITFQPVAR